MTFDKTYPTKELRKCKNPLVLALAEHSFMYYVLSVYVDSYIIQVLPYYQCYVNDQFSG